MNGQYLQLKLFITLSSENNIKYMSLVERFYEVKASILFIYNTKNKF